MCHEIKPLTFMFKNETKILYLTLTETGEYGRVIDTVQPPYVRWATEEDMITNQYTECQFLRGVK